MDQEVETLSRATSTEPGSLRRKFQAVLYAKERGLDEFSIASNGQRITLSNYSRARKRANGEQQRVVRWRIPVSLADAIQAVEIVGDGQEEALQSRLVRVLKMRTSEEFWEFIHSVFSDLSDADLIHLAGESSLKEKPHRRRIPTPSQSQDPSPQGEV